MMKARSLCGVGISIALAAAIIIPFVNEIRDRHAAILSAQERLKDLRARRLDPAEAKGWRERVFGAFDPRTGLLPPLPDAEAASRVEMLLKEAAQRNGGKMLALSVVPSGLNDGQQVIRASIRVNIADTGLESFLKTIEESQPTGFFERFRISSASGYNQNEESFRLEILATIVLYRDIPAAVRPKS